MSVDYSVRYTSQPLAAAQSPAPSLAMTVGKTELPASINSTMVVTIELLNKDGVYIKGDVVNLTVDKGTIQSLVVDNGDVSLLQQPI